MEKKTEKIRLTLGRQIIILVGPNSYVLTGLQSGELRISPLKALNCVVMEIYAESNSRIIEGKIKDEYFKIDLEIA